MVNGLAVEHNREFKKLRRLPQQIRHFKIKLYLGLRVLRLFHVGHVVQISELYFYVKAENETFTAAGLRCRQNPKYENFTSSFRRLRQKLHQRACHTCSTIIFPR